MSLPGDKIFICENCDTVKGSEDSGYPCPVMPSRNGRPAGFHVWKRSFKGRPDDSPAPRHPRGDRF